MQNGRTPHGVASLKQQAPHWQSCGRGRGGSPRPVRQEGRYLDSGKRILFRPCIDQHVCTRSTTHTQQGQAEGVRQWVTLRTRIRTTASTVRAALPRCWHKHVTVEEDGWRGWFSTPSSLGTIYASSGMPPAPRAGMPQARVAKRPPSDEARVKNVQRTNTCRLVVARTGAMVSAYVATRPTLWPWVSSSGRVHRVPAIRNRVRCVCFFAFAVLSALCTCYRNRVRVLGLPTC
jgi:hypothetical protein